MGLLDRFRRPQTAAVKPLTDADRRGWRRLRQPWQERAEFMAANMGVVRFASGVGADACARSDLRVEKLVDPTHDTWEPSEDNLLAGLLRQYRGKRTTQRELVRQHAWHEDTIGEAIIVFEQGARGVTFSVRSPLAAEPQGAGLLLRDVPGGTERDQTARWFPDEMIRRVWVPDDTWPGYAVSPLKAVLDDCERYWTLGRRMRRTYESALVGNGIVWAPSEAATRLPRGQTEPGSIGQPGTDLERDYYAAALRAFQEDDSVEAIAPILWQWSKEFGGPVKIDLSSVLDEKAIEHRGEALEGIARGLNYPSRLLVSGVGDGNHWPCDETTEVFTRDRGFVHHSELAAGDVVLTLDHAHGETVWAPLAGIIRGTALNAEMVRVLTPSVDALTTPDHRWPALRHGLPIWTHSADLRPDDRIIRAAPHAGLPTEAKYRDALVELVGWFVTEGTIRKSGRENRGRQVLIGQSHRANPDRVARIRRCLTELFGPAHEGTMPRVGQGTPDRPRWREFREDRGMTLFSLNKPAGVLLLDAAPDKEIDREFVLALTASQLVLLLEAAALGDGHLKESGGLSVNQRDPARLDGLALAAVLAGRPISWTTAERRGGFSDGTQHYLNVPAARGYDVPVGTTSIERYTGTIFCPQVPPHSSFLARRNGAVYFTGNSDWLLQEQFAKEAIAPKMERIAWGDITEVFLRPGLRSLGARGLFTDDPELYRVGFDLTPIIVHPDQSAMVLELYKLGVVSDSAVLEFAGLDATVAPDSAELQRWVMRTQIMRETIRAMQNPGDSLPSGAEQVIESAPPGGTPILPAVAALEAGSTVRETVRVGPMAGEELGWLD